MSNREIKFRAWDNVNYMSNPFTLEDILLRKIEFTSEAKIMEFTGLQDKNGKRIWEGDVIEWNHEKLPEQVMHSLNWENRIGSRASFMSAWGSTNGKTYKTFMNIYDPSRFAKVIGNIYEHPELIESK